MVETSLNYPYKYADRTSLDTLLRNASHTDDILIIQDGAVTDTAIANIAFFDGVAWYTPKKPLLKGTTRQRLIDKGFLIPKDVYIEDLSHYTHVALMNAMLGFKILKNITIFDTKGIPYDY
jgi:4-amino-4-deoxychorismate lyase